MTSHPKANIRRIKDNNDSSQNSPSATRRKNCRTAINRESYINRCISMISHSGLRVTSARRAVINCLAQSDQPLTIAQLSEELSSQFNKMQEKKGDLPENYDLSEGGLSKVTLYRIVADLEKIHLIHQSHPNGGYLLCTHVGCSDHSHILITCSSCEETKEATVPSEYLSPLVFFLQSKGTALPNPPILRVEGLCSDCKV